MLFHLLSTPYKHTTTLFYASKSNTQTRWNKHTCLSIRGISVLQSKGTAKHKLFVLRLFFFYNSSFITSNDFNKYKYLNFFCFLMFRWKLSKRRSKRNLSYYVLFYNLFCGSISFELQLKVSTYCLTTPFIRDYSYNQSVLFFLNVSRYMWSSPISFHNFSRSQPVVLHSSRTFTSFSLFFNKKYSVDNTFLKSNIYSLYSVRLPIFSGVRCSFKRPFSKFRKSPNLFKHKRIFLRRIRNSIGLGKRVKNFNSNKDSILRLNHNLPFLQNDLITFLFLISRSRQRGKFFFFKNGRFFLYTRAFFRFLKNQHNILRGYRSLKKRQKASFFYNSIFNTIRLRKYKSINIKETNFLFRRESMDQARRRQTHSRQWFFFFKWRLLLNSVFWHNSHKPTFNGYSYQGNNNRAIHISSINPNLFFYYHFFFFFFFVLNHKCAIINNNSFGVLRWNDIKSFYFFHFRYWRFCYITNFIFSFYNKKYNFVHILYKSTIFKIDSRSISKGGRGDYFLNVYYYYTKFISLCFFFKRFSFTEINLLFFFFDYNINIMLMTFFQRRTKIHLNKHIFFFYEVNNFLIFSWMLNKFFRIFIYSRLLYLSRLFFYLVIIKKQLLIFDYMLLFNFCVLYVDLFFTFSKNLFYFNANNSLLVTSYIFSTKIRYTREFCFTFFVMLNLFKLRYNRIYLNLQFNYFLQLSKNIEYTLFQYSSLFFLFLPRFFYKILPPMNNAKIISDYLIVWLRMGVRVIRIFSLLRKWQNISFTNSLIHSRRLLRVVGNKQSDAFSDYLKGLFFECKFPVKGIRVVFSGPPYKARRKSKLRYHTWVSNDFVTGKMPLSTLDLQIDYYQAHAIVRRACIGVKVWLLFDNVE